MLKGYGVSVDGGGKHFNIDMKSKVTINGKEEPGGGFDIDANTKKVEVHTMRDGQTVEMVCTNNDGTTDTIQVAKSQIEHTAQAHDA